MTLARQPAHAHAQRRRCRSLARPFVLGQRGPRRSGGWPRVAARLRRNGVEAKLSSFEASFYSPRAFDWCVNRLLTPTGRQYVTSRLPPIRHRPWGQPFKAVLRRTGLLVLVFRLFRLLLFSFPWARSPFRTGVQGRVAGDPPPTVAATGRALSWSLGLGAPVDDSGCLGVPTCRGAVSSRRNKSQPC